MTEMTLFWIKASGAAIGSSIALVFRPEGDPWLKLFQRFIVGTAAGFIMAPVILDRLGWKHTWDYWLAAATIGGLSGYLILQFAFSEQVHMLVRDKFLKSKK